MCAPSMRRPQVLDEHYAGLYLLQTSAATISEQSSVIATARTVGTVNSQFFFLASRKSICNASMSSEDPWQA